MLLPRCGPCWGQKNFVLQARRGRRSDCRRSRRVGTAMQARREGRLRNPSDDQTMPRHAHRYVTEGILLRFVCRTNRTLNQMCLL